MSEREIRFLVEGYYDVQKMRVETFNRIVAYVKSHGQVETQPIDASHLNGETHEKAASHLSLENHFEDASHGVCETRLVSASGEGRYAAIARLMLKHPPHEISELVWFHNTLYETEKQLAKRIDKWSRNHPLRINYLNHVQGIGPILASGLIAWLSPINRFATISRLWKYCGLAPNQKRKHGEKLDYNPKLKTFMWKIGSSFIKQKTEKCVYRRLYETKKAELEKRPDLAEALKNKQPGAKLHIHLLALRFAVKRFLADLWIEWRKMEGLPISEPYAIAVLKHPKEAV